MKDSDIVIYILGNRLGWSSERIGKLSFPRPRTIRHKMRQYKDDPSIAIEALSNSHAPAYESLHIRISASQSDKLLYSS